MNKFFAIIFVLVSSIFADDMDDRIIPDFKISIPKGDTNFSFNREIEIKKITINDSAITTREKVAIVNPSFQLNKDGKMFGME
jgi:uncharacterized protein YaiL (DUF2058 family)